MSNSTPPAGTSPLPSFRFVGIANPGDVVRRIDYDVRESHRDNWTTSL